MKEVIPGGEKDGWRYFEVEVKVIDVFSELFETFYFSTDLENFRTFQIPSYDMARGKRLMKFLKFTKSKIIYNLIQIDHHSPKIFSAK